MRWESFRADIETVVLTPTAERKSNASRKPIDAIVMYRMLVRARASLNKPPLT